MIQILLGFFIATTAGLIATILIYLKQRKNKIETWSHPRIKMLELENKLLYKDLLIITSDEERITQQEKNHVIDKYRYFNEREKQEKEMWYRAMGGFNKSQTAQNKTDSKNQNL